MKIYNIKESVLSNNELFSKYCSSFSEISLIRLRYPMLLCYQCYYGSNCTITLQCHGALIRMALSMPF